MSWIICFIAGLQEVRCISEEKHLRLNHGDEEVCILKAGGQGPEGIEQECQDLRKIFGLVSWQQAVAFGTGALSYLTKHQSPT